MHPALAFAIGDLIVLALISIGVVLLFRRRTASIRPVAPPPAALVSPSVEYDLLDPSVDEWEAHAPYPDHALQAARPAPSPSFDDSTRTPYRAPNPYREDIESVESRSHSSGAAMQDDEPFETVPPSPADHPQRFVVAKASAPDYLSYAPAWATEGLSSSGDTPHCPHCGSSRVDVLNIGRKAGTTIGGVAGATSGVAMALSGAEAGAAMGAIGGPLGAAFGGLTGAVIAGLLGSAAGSIAGSAVGGALDDSFLNNYRCLSCGQSFGAQYR
ncbi:hypothetical protein [Burkholderia gladioli]|uniref:hypothetical protein n=1 Tax=Burkholderia gladioli TaxID=28095 RepID=UPI001FC8309F|nr:hypothetical protein [Burkholderia gladioli]